MTDGGYREEVLNVVLAQLLDERGVVSAPEKVLRQVARQRRRRMSDVLVTFQGLRTIIEGKVGDQAGAGPGRRAPLLLTSGRVSGMNVANIGGFRQLPLDAEALGKEPD